MKGSSVQIPLAQNMLLCILVMQNLPETHCITSRNINTKSNKWTDRWMGQKLCWVISCLQIVEYCAWNVVHNPRECNTIRRISRDDLTIITMIWKQGSCSVVVEEYMNLFITKYINVQVCGNILKP